MTNLLSPLLVAFANDVSAKLNLGGSTIEPEDQLRSPFENFLKASGDIFQMKIIPGGEARLENVGRPDYAVYCNGALSGYAELKQPGKGANPNKYQGRDKGQWERFKSLPNVLYTDGNEWGLYQNGEPVAPIVRLAGDIVAEGGQAVSEENAVALEPILREFLTWNPIVPSDAAGLAKLLAPICRLLRQEVEEAMEPKDSPFHILLGEWQKALFPGASSAKFADAYAQTVTFALLLANAEGANTLDLKNAEETLTTDHALLGKALKIFTDNLRPEEKPLSLGLLQRITAQIPARGWRAKDKDPWLYFYEYFLAEYDPQLRKDAGVYYTPVEVVQAMVGLTENILVNRLNKTQGFASPGVMTLDPAVGTGTFLLGIISHTLGLMAENFGPGAVAGYAETLGRQLHGFEMLVGPYAVAQLRISRALAAYGASLPSGGPKVYLTDTLESPSATPEFPSLLSRELSEQHKKALEVKNTVPILVCIGNPPYDRHGAADAGNRKETGGWVRWGDEDEHGKHRPEQALLAAFSAPAKEAGQGGHLKNLYNLYVYFWRWALWKVFEQGEPDTPGVVSFITASSFLDGPAFCGMRERMRRLCDDIWIIDLGGEGRGSRKEENIFNIQTPVAIAVAARYGEKAKDAAANVRYLRIGGTQAEKLRTLAGIKDFAALPWEECAVDWQASFMPKSEGAYFSFPLLTDIFPWQHSGVQFKRTWPIAPDIETLYRRWQTLCTSPDKELLFRETGARALSAFSPDELKNNGQSSIMPSVRRYAYRSFDTFHCFSDARFCDRPRPDMVNAHGERQIYFASIFTQMLSHGPALTLSVNIPDLDYFSGRGAKNIIPLYRDADASQPNILHGLLDLLAAAYGQPVSPEDLAAYVYAVLAHNNFTEHFQAELTSKEIRLPLTKDPALFTRATEIGRRLIRLHSYGERMIPEGSRPEQIPPGSAKCLKAVPGTPEGYPEDFSYNEATRTLHVGEGEFAPVSPEVFNFEVSGLKVVQSWLKYRMKKGAGKKSSPLDDIRPEHWTAEFTTELLYLLWILEATVAGYPEQEQLLSDILNGPLFRADELPEIPDEARAAPEKPNKKLTEYKIKLF